MSLYDYNDFAPRMEQAQAIAIHHRNRDGGGGGQVVTRSARQAMFDARFPDDESRADWEADEAERIARAQDEADALEAAEIERFGCDLSGRERLAPGLPSRGRAAVAQPAPARIRGNARRRKDPTMTGREYERACRKVGLSVYASAKFFGMSLRQAQRIAAGEYHASEAVAKLLRLMIAQGLTADDVS